MKKCNECYELKLLTEFHRSKRNKDGYRYKCKQCQKKHAKKYYLANREKILVERQQEGTERENRLAYLSQWAKDNITRKYDEFEESGV